MCVCVHKKTGGERVYTALTTMLSCHHFEANLWDRKVETPEDQSQCCWWNTVLPCSSQETYVPGAMNIPHSCEVQSNLQMLGISVRKALMVPGEEILSHTSERHWPMLTTTGGGYQRATSSPPHLLLQWEMARLSFNSDGADKMTFLDTLIQAIKAFKDWDFELDYIFS